MGEHRIPFRMTDRITFEITLLLIMGKREIYMKRLVLQTKADNLTEKNTVNNQNKDKQIFNIL